MTDVIIHKRDGGGESFDRFKLFNSLIGATATPEQAEQVTSEVERWLAESTLESITVTKLREKVVEVLKSVNKQAAGLYEEFDRPM